MADLSKFLIIERDAKQAEVYSGLIREVSRAQVDVVPTTETAFERLAGNTYQVIILDSSSTADPIAALERMKGLNPNTGLVLIASNASIAEAVTMMRMGVDDYFPKPVNPDHFKLAVRRCLDKRDLYLADDSAVSFMNLINSCQLVSASLDEQRIFETVMTYLRRETTCRGQALYKYHGEKWERVPTTCDSDVDVIDVALEWSGSLNKLLQKEQSCHQLPKSVMSPELLVFHFKWGGNKDYYAVCASPDTRCSTAEVFTRYKMLQMQVHLSSKNISNYTAVRDLLYKDDATSLHNARYLNVSLDRAFAAQKKSGHKFAVLFVDLDHFKKVNDGHGHLVGTQLLNEVGERMKFEVRDGDTVCRYGGDEFVVIMNNVNLNDARDIAERIRHSIEVKPFLQNEGININLTVSVGVAVCPDHASTRNEIIAAADHAMYAAKRKSKNMVYVAGEHPVPKKAA